MIRRISVEMIVAFLIGGLPMLVAYRIGDTDLLFKTVSSMFPNELLSWHFSILTLLGFSATALLKKSADPDSSELKQIFILEIAREIQPSLLALFRLFAGALITFPALWFAADRNNFSWLQAIFFFSFGFGCLVVAVFYHYGTDWIIGNSRSSKATP